jgi:hypothetical protein
MAPLPSGGPALSRRSFLAVSAAGLAVLAAGCTSDASETKEPVTAAQVDSLAAQVTVQEALVAAYAAAGAANASFGKEIAGLAEQAGAQLDRLRKASPGSGPSSSSPASGSAAPGSAADVGPDPRGWLKQKVTATADSHSAACLEQSGARAALLGSIAAGLRGHAARLG